MNKSTFNAFLQKKNSLSGKQIHTRTQMEKVIRKTFKTLKIIKNRKAETHEKCKINRKDELEFKELDSFSQF